MFVCKSLPVLAAGVLFLSLARPAAADSILVGGIEDYPGGRAYEGNGDYNDLMFQMTGNISVLAPLAQFRRLEPDMIDESGDIFWGQHSGDGDDYNFGYCAMGLGSCTVSGLAPGPLYYLARDGGGAPLTQLFQASGVVTMSLLFEMSSNINVNTLGWYDPAHPTERHQIFVGPDSAGTSAQFTPNGVFALYSTNGFGQFYSSLALDNQQELLTQQHFAFLEVVPAETPEPATGGLAAIVLAGAWMGKTLWRNFHPLRSTRC